MASFDDYKSLRNKVRKYETLSLVLPCIKKLHDISKKPVYENGGYYPWHLLYLIKVAFLEGGKNGSKIATMVHINAALNQINDLGNESRFLNSQVGWARSCAHAVSHGTRGHRKATLPDCRSARWW